MLQIKLSNRVVLETLTNGLLALHLPLAKGLVAKHLVANGLVAKCSLLPIQTWCPIQAESYLKKGRTATRPNALQTFV